MKNSLIGAMVALALGAAATLSVVSPAEAAPTKKFWVYNDSDYEIYHVYADRDTSGGQRDLLGPNGVIPTYDQATVLRPKSNTCWSNVAVVASDGNEGEIWVWLHDVNICSTDGVRVTDYDFDN